MTRFEAQVQNSSQMGLGPKMKINTVARTKLGVYTGVLERPSFDQSQFDPSTQVLEGQIQLLFSCF